MSNWSHAWICIYSDKDTDYKTLVSILKKHNIAKLKERKRFIERRRSRHDAIIKLDNAQVAQAQHLCKRMYGNYSMVDFQRKY